MARIRDMATTYRTLQDSRRAADRHSTTVAVLLALLVGTGMMLLFWTGGAEAL